MVGASITPLFSQKLAMMSAQYLIKQLYYIFQYHLHSDLKSKYINEDDPLIFIAVPKGLLQPLEVDCALQNTMRLDRLTFQRLYDYSSVQLCFIQGCV